MSWVGDQLKFNETGFFFFSPELSNGTLFDEVEHVDRVYLGAARIIDDLVWPFDKLASRLMKLFISKSVLTRHTVGQLLFEGYSEFTGFKLKIVLENKISKTPEVSLNFFFFVLSYKDELADIASIFWKKLPVVDGKVGFFVGQNGSAIGEFAVYSGADGNLDKLNQITSYKGSS